MGSAGLWRYDERVLRVNVCADKPRSLRLEGISGYAVDVEAWLNRLPVLGYMAVMVIVPTLGFLVAWVQGGFPSAAVAVELVLYSTVPFALVMTLAREVHRRRRLEEHSRTTVSR
jgi:hypothetical protein